MAISTDVTLGLILEHKQLFFDLIDHAEAQDGPGADELSISYYRHRLSSAIKQSTPAVARKLAEALDIANLHRCGLLAYHEERDDRLLFKAFVLDMIRHLDRTRLKELSDTQLNSLREQLTHSRELITRPSLSWDKHDPEYLDTVTEVISTVRNAGSQIRQNIEALQGQSIHLASIVDNAQADGVTRTKQVEVALNKIFEITERNINPTLLFLDPLVDWKGAGKDAPMKIIEDIKVRFSRRSLFKEYGQLNRAHLAMLHSADRINAVRRSLDSYLRMHDDQRKLYEQIERRYGMLREKVMSLHDGKTRYRLKSTDHHFDALCQLEGLKTRKSEFPAKINWPRDEGRSMLDEFIRVRLETYRYRASMLKQEASTAGGGVDPEDQANRERFSLVAEAAGRVKLLPGKDVYQQIHDVLSVELDDYRLSDILDAIPFALGQSGLQVLARRRSLTSGSQQFEYFERQIGEHH